MISVLFFSSSLLRFPNLKKTHTNCTALPSELLAGILAIKQTSWKYFGSRTVRTGVDGLSFKPVTTDHQHCILHKTLIKSQQCSSLLADIPLWAIQHWNQQLHTKKKYVFNIYNLRPEFLQNTIPELVQNANLMQLSYFLILQNWKLCEADLMRMVRFHLALQH